MFVPCPHCGFLAALILPTQATAGPGRAAPRCPRCDRPLRVDTPEPSAPIQGDDADASEVLEALDASNAPDASAGSDPGLDTGTHAGAGDHGERTAIADQPASIATPPAGRPASAPRAPSFVRGDARAARSRLAWPWYAVIVMLGVVLVLQLLLAQRDELAASARWRPWVEGLCGVLPCDVPAWREPQAFTMLDRSVQPSTSVAGVLAVEANFRNDARWPQPWPTLVLSLSDAEGRQVGARAFAPAEYRPPGVDAADLLAPGQSATVRLQVREPAPRIVAFTFDFQ